MNLYKRALELKDEIILHRRFFHKNAETGFDIPITKQYIFSELSKLGIVAFNEDALPKGSALLSHCAVRFLETH